MQRTNGPYAVSTLPAPTSNIAGQYYTDQTGNPATSTIVSAQDLNGIQEEIIAVIVGGGLTPNSATNNQMLSALPTIIAAQFATKSLSAYGYQVFPGGLIIQWGNNGIVGGYQQITFPLAFPNACEIVVVTEGNASGGTWGSNEPTIHGVANLTKTHYQGWALSYVSGNWTGSSSGINQNFVAIGY